MMGPNLEAEKINREYPQRASELAYKVQTQLKCPAAKFLPADVLLSLGIRAFVVDQMAPSSPDASALIRRIVGMTKTSEEDIARLIGSATSEGIADFEDSLIVSKLRALEGRASTDWQQEFGNLYAYKEVVMGNSRWPSTGIRYSLSPLDDRSVAVTDLSSEQILLPRPQHTIELGAGLVSFPKVLPKKEASITPRYTMIDRSPFTAAALKKGAELFGRLGLTPKYGEQLTVICDSMSIALVKLLDEGVQADLIIASMVHSAGKEELEWALEYSSRLLHAGGRLAIQLPHQVSEGEADADWAVNTASNIFGAPERKVIIPLVVDLTGERHTGISALFTKGSTNI